jgi:hypothetical protein
MRRLSKHVISIIKLLERYDALKNQGISLSKELHKLNMHQTKSSCSTTHKDTSFSYQELLDRISNEQSINATLKSKHKSIKILLEKQIAIERELTNENKEAIPPPQSLSPPPSNLYRRKANSSHKSIAPPLPSPSNQDEIANLKKHYEQTLSENQEMEDEYETKINKLKDLIGIKSEEYDALSKKCNTLMHRKNELQNMSLPLLKVSKEQKRKNEIRNRQLKVFTSLSNSDDD